jgi:pimeloyl-ACP methyl ester carboxylesterase
MPKVVINGVGIYYEESGLDDRTPLFFMGHGRKSWMWQVQYFSEYYRVVTHDRRGTGFSDDPPGDWTVKDYVEDLRGLMDYLGVERAIVGGSSLGGAISCLFGLDYPDRVLALVLNGQVYYWDKFTNDWVNDMIAGRASLEHQPRSFEWQETGPLTTDPEFAMSRLGSYFLETMREAGSWRTPEQSRSNTVRMLRSLQGWDLRPRAEELRRLGESVPVLVMIGSLEAQSAITGAYEWHRAIPNSEFIVNQGCHHSCPRENPALWNDRAHAFLKRHGL